MRHSFPIEPADAARLAPVKLQQPHREKCSGDGARPSVRFREHRTHRRTRVFSADGLTGHNLQSRPSSVRLRHDNQVTRHTKRDPEVSRRAALPMKCGQEQQAMHIAYTLLVPMTPPHIVASTRYATTCRAFILARTTKSSRTYQYYSIKRPTCQRRKWATEANTPW